MAKLSPNNDQCQKYNLVISLSYVLNMFDNLFWDT